jgi:hypothetical protein
VESSLVQLVCVDDELPNLAIGAEKIRLMNFEGRPEKGLPFSFVG